MGANRFRSFFFLYLLFLYFLFRKLTMKATLFLFLAVLLRRDLEVTKVMTTATFCLQHKKTEHRHKYVHSIDPCLYLTYNKKGEAATVDSTTKGTRMPRIEARQANTSSKRCSSYGLVLILCSLSRSLPFLLESFPGATLKSKYLFWLCAVLKSNPD